MSGRAAFRECRNAGNRTASWNGRTAAGRVATAGAPRWQAVPRVTTADRLISLQCACAR